MAAPGAGAAASGVGPVSAQRMLEHIASERSPMAARPPARVGADWRGFLELAADLASSDVGAGSPAWRTLGRTQPCRSDDNRYEVIWRLEVELQEAEARLLQASRDHSLARAAKRGAEARLWRAQSPSQANDFCLSCWVNHQRLRRLLPAPSPQPRLIDRWKCEADDCGHVEDRRIASRQGSPSFKESDDPWHLSIHLCAE